MQARAFGMALSYNRRHERPESENGKLAVSDHTVGQTNLLDLTIQLILTPMILQLVEKRRRATYDRSRFKDIKEAARETESPVILQGSSSALAATARNHPGDARAAKS
jgi:hypothetical protein